MKTIHIFSFILMNAFAVDSSSDAQTVASSPSANLGPIAFFTAHEWDAQLPPTPGGKKKKIHAQFTWAANGHAIRISNQMVIDGKATPYIEGLYAWDPQQHAIVFWYVGGEGSFTQGTVRSDAGTLVHEFKQTQPDGKAAEFVARVTPHDNKAWDNEIAARNEKGLTPIVKVQYKAAD